MHCPGCGEAMGPREYEGVRIHTCDACGGELLDQNAVRTIIATRDIRFSAELRSALAERTPLFGEVADVNNLPRSCPHCTRSMLPINYGGDTGIAVDRCTGCGLLFLDRTELEKIQILCERFDDEADERLATLALELEQARREAAEDTSRAFAGSRFAFVNALINRVLDAA